MTFWRSKPPPGVRIDPDHPLALGLLLCWAFNEAGGYPQDAVGRLSNVALNAGAAAAAPVWVGRDGGGVDLAATPYLKTSTGDVLTGRPFAGDISIVVRALTTTTNNQAIVNKQTTSGATNTTFDFQIRAGGALTLVRSSSGFRDHLGVSVTANVIQTWGVSASGQMEVIPSFYVNGVGGVGSLGSGSGTGPPNAVDRDIDVGFRSITTSLAFGGSIFFVAIWSRLLSAQEHAAMAANPYRLFAAPAWSRIRPTAAGGGGGGTGARSMVVVAG